MGPHIFCVIGSRGCCAVFVVPGISGQSKTIYARIWGHCELAISLQTLSTKHIPKMVVLYRGSVHIGVCILMIISISDDIVGGQVATGPNVNDPVQEPLGGQSVTEMMEEHKQPIPLNETDSYLDVNCLLKPRCLSFL